MDQTITYTLADKSGKLTEAELNSYLRENAGILDAARKGEKQYKDSLGWLDVEEWAGDAWLTRYEELARRVNRDADALVVIGIGGSNQAARAMVSAMGSKSGTEIVWAGNTISAHSINGILNHLKGKSVYIDVIAKNFETLEPGIAFRALRSFLKEQYGEKYAERVIATGTRGSRLEQLCTKHGFTFLPFPEDVGGRYTALTPIGLFPAAVAGLDLRAIAAGARRMREQLLRGPAEENMALRFAAVRNLLYRKGYRMEMLSFFEPRLFRLAKWWTQLFAESEGKDGKGLYPVIGSFSEDLHSIGQFIQEGTPVLFENFLEVREREASPALQPDEVDDAFGYLDGKDFDEINRAAFQATVAAHSEKLPCGTLSVPALDEDTFGQLFYFFPFACYLSGKMLGVNPFDQPGVEAYKKQMFRILGK